MSSDGVQPINVDTQDANQSTELNEVILGESEEDSAEKLVYDVVSSPSSLRSHHRLHETETVGGVQQQLQQEDSETNAWTRYLGVVLALLSTLMFSFNQIAQKVLLKPRSSKRNNITTTTHFSPFKMAAWTFPFQIVFTIPLLIYYSKFEKKELITPIRPFRKHIKTQILIAVRSFSDSGAFILFFIGLGYLDLAEAVCIISTAPVLVYILCRIFLKEPVGYVIIGTAALSIGGVVVISEPPGINGDNKPFDTNKLLGIMFAVLATLGLSISMVTVRFMKHVYHGLLNTFSHICGAVVGIICAAAFNQLTIPANPKPFNVNNDWFLLIIIAAMTVTAQTLLILALQFEQAGPVALIRTLGVLLAFVWQTAFLHRRPTKFSAIGGAMIVVGVVITILRKWMSTLPEDNPYRKRFACLLK